MSWWTNIRDKVIKPVAKTLVNSHPVLGGLGLGRLIDAGTSDNRVIEGAKVVENIIKQNVPGVQQVYDNPILNELVGAAAKPFAGDKVLKEGSTASKDIAKEVSYGPTTAFATKATAAEAPKQHERRTKGSRAGHGDVKMSQRRKR